MADIALRSAGPADYAAIGAIAAEGDSHADHRYLDFIAANGALVVATDSEQHVVAFAGTLPVGDVTMLTDLFVTTRARGRGLGGALLAHVLAGAERRMTFSSTHEAALPAYVRAGMTPSWRLLYLRGRATARPRLATTDRDLDLDLDDDRPELLAHWRQRGASSIAGATVIDEEGEHRIVRLRGHHAVERFDHVLASLPSGTTVTCCVPEQDPLAAHAVELGFEEFDHDIFCASPGVGLPADLHILDAGLV